ncbi:MAG: hypothetical protein ACYC0V_18050, partial [Armatimonadota bacterium]
MRYIALVLLAMTTIVLLPDSVLSSVKKPISGSKSNPLLLSYKGNHHFKLVGYDWYDLLNNRQIDENMDWRSNADKKRPLYESFIDMLAENNANFTRCFVWDGWGNDLFCWKRVSTPEDPIKDGQRYARVDLSKFDDRFWKYARKALEYASKKGVIVEITLFDRCGVDSDSIGPRRWSFHPLNPDNSLPGTIGSELLPKGKERGIPYVYDLNNQKLKSIYEAYLTKWVTATKGLDNVIFELENEGYSGYDFNNWAAKYLKQDLKCPFLVAANSFHEPEKCYSIPEIDIIADHGEKSPKEVDQLLMNWKQYGKVIVVDTDGWRTSEESYEKSLQVAQRALDLNLHYNHKARSNKPCGDSGKPYIELMAGIQSDPSESSPYRLAATMTDKGSVDIILDSKNVENGLRLDLPWDGSGDGWTVIVERQGKNGRMNTNGPNNRKGQTIFFDVEDGFIFKGDHTKVQIEVEYYDAAPDNLILEYDAVGDPGIQHKKITFKCNGTADWQHASFDLDDAYFGNHVGEHADFGFRR